MFTSYLQIGTAQWKTYALQAKVSFETESLEMFEVEARYEPPKATTKRKHPIKCFQYQREVRDRHLIELILQERR